MRGSSASQPGYRDVEEVKLDQAQLPKAREPGLRSAADGAHPGVTFHPTQEVGDSPIQEGHELDRRMPRHSARFGFS